MSNIPEDLVVEQPNAAETQGKPGEGREHVEMPPEIQDRFNRLYRQVKAQDEKFLLQAKHTEKLTKDLTATRQELEAEKSRDAISSLRGQIKEARENGDDDKVERLREQLTELQAEAKVQEKLRTLQPKPEEKAADTAPVDLSRADTNLIVRWANETDPDGNFVRPWTQGTNARVDEASAYLAKILADPEHDDLTMPEKLDMVDKKFGVKKTGADRRGSGPQVAGADLTGAGAALKNGLKDEEKRIAHKLFPHLGKADAEKAYAAGK